VTDPDLSFVIPNDLTLGLIFM